MKLPAAKTACEIACKYSLNGLKLPVVKPTKLSAKLPVKSSERPPAFKTANETV